MEKKNYLRRMDLMIRSFLLLAIFSFGSGMQVMAEKGQTADDPIVLESGQTYTLSQAAFGYKGCYAVYTATQDGVLTMSYNCDNLPLYTDGTYKTLSSTQPVWNNDFAPKTYDLNVKSGETYYFARDFMSNVGTFSVAFSTSSTLEFVSASPAEGETMYARTGVEIKFSKRISYSKVLMKVGSEEQDVTGYCRSDGTNVVVTAESLLMNMYTAGKLKKDDAVTFTVEDLALASDKTVKYGTDGKFTLTVKAAAKPIQMVSADNVPDGTNSSLSTFLSYFMSDNEKAVATFTFDGDINMSDEMKPTATLMYGERSETEDVDYAEIPLTVNPFGSNAISVSFKGAVRRPADMVTNATLFPKITLKLGSVRSLDGQYAYTTSVGMLGSYLYNYEYKVVDYNLITEFSPMTSATAPASIDGVDNIELLVSENGGGKMVYEGATFAYKNGGKDETKTVKVTSAPDADDPEYDVITIPVPEFAADANSNITVSLSGVETPDGLPHAEDLTAVYTTAGRTVTGLEVTSATLEVGTEVTNLIGATLEKLPRFSVIRLKTNRDSETGYIEYVIRDITTTDPDQAVLKVGYNAAQDIVDGVSNGWKNTLYVDYKLLKDHEYVLTLKAYKTAADAQGEGEPTVGEATFSFFGATKEFEYSDVTLLTDITNPIKLNSVDDNKVVLDFSAPVNIADDGAFINQGFGMKSTCTVSSNDTKTQWTVTIPASVMTSMPDIMLSVFVKDEAGRVLKGNVGTEETSFFSISLTADFNKPTFTTDPEDGANVESLKTVKFGYKGGIARYEGSTDNITIVSKGRDGGVLATSVSCQSVIPEGSPADYTPVECIVTFDNEITADGAYMMLVPEGYFILGEQMSTELNAATTVFYTIGKTPAGSENITVDPTPGKVQELSSFLLTFDDQEEVSWGNGNPTLTDDKGTAYGVTTSFGTGFNQLVVKLTDSPVTAEGTYTLTLPAGCVGLGSDGTPTEEAYTFVYTISKAVDPAEVATTDPAPGKVTSLKNIKLTFAAQSEVSWGNGNPIMTDEDGNRYGLEATIDYADDYNQLRVILDEEITANGTYTLTLLAGSVQLGENGIPTTSEQTFEYVIGTGDYIANIMTANGETPDVYTVSGTLVKKAADANALKSLAKGLYIIAGKKVIVK